MKKFHRTLLAGCMIVAIVSAASASPYDHPVTVEDFDTDPARASYALGLRLSVALAVGLAIVIGVWRILSGWPIHLMIAGGYVLVVVLTIFAPEEIIGIAYDSGGVTTSTITVPLVTALGVGLASSVEGRNPVVDGFGLIAFASLTPMIFVMIYGILW